MDLPDVIRTISLRGSPREMGQTWGEAYADEIHRLHALRVQNALTQALAYGGRRATPDDLRRLGVRSIEPTRAFDPEGWAEMEGIAAGARLPIEDVVVLGGLTDLRDALAWGPADALDGCSSVVVHGDASASGGVIGGQTWDLATDNMPYVVGVERRPSHAPRTWSLTTVGCLSLIGMNEEGLAVGTTNLRTLDARPGVCYLNLVHRALRATSLDEAVTQIVTAYRAGGHFYYLMDASGRAVAVECAATAHRVTPITAGAHVHTNHAVASEVLALEGQTPSASSHARAKRLTALVEAARGRVDLAMLQRFFGDRENGVDAICRYDYGGISTNAAVVMDPARRSVRVCQGPPDASTWIELVPEEARRP